jgi:hypothetical protein
MKEIEASHCSYIRRGTFYPETLVLRSRRNVVRAVANRFPKIDKDFYRHLNEICVDSWILVCILYIFLKKKKIIIKKRNFFSFLRYQ